MQIADQQSIHALSFSQFENFGDESTFILETNSLQLAPDGEGCDTGDQFTSADNRERTDDILSVG